MVIIYPLPLKMENTIKIRKIWKYTLKADVTMSFSFFLIFSFFLVLISFFTVWWKKFTNSKFPHWGNVAIHFNSQRKQRRIKTLHILFWRNDKMYLIAEKRPNFWFDIDIDNIDITKFNIDIDRYRFLLYISDTTLKDRSVKMAYLVK